MMKLFSNLLPLKLMGGLIALGTAVNATPAMAVTITNGIPLGTLNHWTVDVLSGGESRNAVKLFSV